MSVVHVAYVCLREGVEKHSSVLRGNEQIVIWNREALVHLRKAVYVYVTHCGRVAPYPEKLPRGPLRVNCFSCMQAGDVPVPGEWRELVRL